MSKTTGKVRVVTVVPGSFVVVFYYRAKQGARWSRAEGSLLVPCETDQEARRVATERRGHLNQFEVMSVAPETETTWREPTHEEARAAFERVLRDRAARSAS